MTKGTLLLTSTGLSAENVYNKFTEFKKILNLKKAVIITTASSEKELNEYSQLAKSQLESAGLTTNFYDFEREGKQDLSKHDVIYVCGGNTFKLLKFAKKINFADDIQKLLERDGVYIGVSAGSIIVGPSIKIAGEVEPDDNEVGLTDLQGLNITDLIIYPHYSLEVEDSIRSFENREKVVVERIDNSKAVLIVGNKKSIV